MPHFVVAARRSMTDFEEFAQRFVIHRIGAVEDDTLFRHGFGQIFGGFSLDNTRVIALNSFRPRSSNYLSCASWTFRGTTQMQVQSGEQRTGKKSNARKSPTTPCQIDLTDSNDLSRV